MSDLTISWKILADFELEGSSMFPKGEGKDKKNLQKNKTKTKNKQKHLDELIKQIK